MNRLLLASAQQQLGMGRSGDRCCLVVMTASPLFDFPQQKEERERENGVNTNTNCRCFCVDQASFLSPCYFLFFCRRLWIQQTRCRRKVRESYHVVMKSRKQLEAQQRYKKEQEERQRIRNEELR